MLSIELHETNLGNSSLSNRQIEINAYGAYHGEACVQQWMNTSRLS